MTTPDLAELRRLLDAANSERVMTASLEMDYSLMRKSTRALFVAAANALPALLDAAAERDALAAKVAEVLAIEPWPMKPATMQSYELDEGMGYNEARDEVRRILLDEEPQP